MRAPALSFALFLALLWGVVSGGTAWAHTALDSNRTLIVAGSSSLVPYSFLGRDGSPQGVLVDYWRLWSRKTGVPVIFALTGWEESLDMVARGGADVHMGLVQTAERGKRLSFSKGITDFTCHLYALESLKARSVADLALVTVGLVYGEEASRYLEEHYPSLKYRYYDSNRELFEALLDGEIQALARDGTMVSYWLISHDVPGLLQPVMPLYTNRIHSAVGKGREEILHGVDEGIDRITFEEMRQLMNAWGASTPAPGMDWRMLAMSVAVVAGFLLLIYSIALRMLVRFRTRQLRQYQEQLEQMVAERTRELEQAGAEYRTIYENAMEGFLRATPQGKLLMLNPAAANMLGYSGVEEALENIWNVREVFADEGEWNLFMEGLARDGAVQQREARMRRVDGNDLWVLGTLRMVRDEAGNELYLEGYGVDMTDRRERERAELESRAARAANKAKSDFLAAMSHEIRTPLNAVLGMGEMLRETELTMEQHHFVSALMSAGRNLLTLVNDVLDFSRIESGHLRLENKPFSPRAVMERIGLETGAKAREKGLELVCMAAPDVPAQVVGDAFRLGQILGNLVGNAIKFTERGEVVVLLRMAGPDEAANHGADPDRHESSLVAQVRDTGIGIPGDRRESIFNRFEQAEAGTTRKFGGSGLGLAICRRLALLMGGTIRVDSEVGRGATFTVVLPLPEHAPPPSAQARLAGVRVAVCDRSPVSREMIRAEVEREGGALLESSDCGELMRLLEAEPEGACDALLLDVGQNAGPDAADGETMVARLHRRWRAMPVVMMVGADDPLLSGRGGVRTGAGREIAVALEKPLSGTRLLDGLLRALGRHAPPAPPAHSESSEPEAGAPHAPDGTPVQGAGLRVLVVDDNAGNRELIGLYLRSTPCTVDFAEDGEQAVALFVPGRYDLVLMDLEMPRMDGFEATRRLRAMEAEARSGPEVSVPIAPVPVVAFTAHAFLEQRKRCEAASFSGYLAKPVTRRQLLRLVDMVSGSRTMTGFVDFSAVHDGTDDESDADRPVRAATVSGNGRHVVEVRERFRPLMDGMLHSVRTGMDEMRTMLEQGDYEQVRRRAHGIKGSCMTYGLVQLAEFFGDISTALAGDPSNGPENHGPDNGLPDVRWAKTGMSGDVDEVGAGVWRSIDNASEYIDEIDIKYV